MNLCWQKIEMSQVKLTDLPPRDHFHIIDDAPPLYLFLHCQNLSMHMMKRLNHAIQGAGGLLGLD
jgi:hypothetical protein